MEDSNRTTRSNGLLKSIGILLLGGLAWYLIDLKNDTYIAPAVSAPGTQANSFLYTNQDLGIRIRYDQQLLLATELENKDAPWRSNTMLEGNRLVTLTLPSAFLPQTNFSEAMITVGISKNPDAVQSCLSPQNGEVKAELTVPIKQMEVFTLTDAGAGNFYDVRSYRMIKKGYCIALEQIIHSTNIGYYDPEQGISEYDRQPLQALLTRVIDSFDQL